MEVVIPPRGRLRSSYRYTWDQNGDVMQVTRISGHLEPQSPAEDRSERQQPAQRPRAGRQTVQWPFQSIATETDVTSPTTSIFGRRATWGPRRILSGQSISATSSSAVADLVPDYIINYLRGETPETVAKRQRNNRGKGGRGRRGVDVEHQHRAHQSRIAEIDGFFEDATTTGLSSAAAGGDEEEMLGRHARRPDGGWRRLLVGWRGGVAINALLSLAIFAVGIVCLVLAIVEASVSSSGESVLFSGSCSAASHLNWALHAAVNVLAATLLAGANYVFQVLSSPTRAEVDAAHARKKWLDLGIPSLRNLAHISGARASLGVVILLAALISQVLYNTVIFTSQTGINYRLLAVTESFLDGAPFSNATENNRGHIDRLDILAIQGRVGQSSLVEQSTADCLAQTGGAFASDFQTVLLVTDVESRRNSLVQTASAAASPNVARLAAVRDKLGDLLLAETDVRSCLAERVGTNTTTCSVSVDVLLLGVVCALNLVTVALVSVVLLARPFTSPSAFDPLVSLGDAVRSFLREPDATTADSCLLSKTDVRQRRWGFREAKHWDPQDLSWLRVPSPRRWFLVALFWAAPTGLAVAALVYVLVADTADGLSVFGAASARALAVFSSATAAPAAVLLASLPQLLLGALYLATNSLLTTYHLSHESSLFALAEPRSLRVSSRPEGQQDTSLYHTLPRPWSWFLAVLFAAMGFVLSQSVFAVLGRFPDGSSSSPSPPSPAPTDPTVAALGFSGAALLVLLSALLLLAITVLGQGLRRSPSSPSIATSVSAFVSAPVSPSSDPDHDQTPAEAEAEAEPKPRPKKTPVVAGNPLLLPGGSCSAVISARCHPPPPPRGAEAPWQLPVTWGVVLGGDGEEPGEPEGAQESAPDVARRCAYTAGGIAPLEVGRSYA